MRLWDALGIHWPPPPRPVISTNAPCPACGNRGCKLAYDAAERHIKRQCNTCGCIVTQPPIEPKLFDKK